MSVLKELSERTDIKAMSEEVKQRRLKMMGYYYTKTGPKRRLQHSNNLGTRRKKKNRKIKNHLVEPGGCTVEKERAEAGWQS